MVHVANAEGHRKMLAFQSQPSSPPPSSTTSQPAKNLSHILIDTISKKFGPISSTETDKPNEEPSSSISIVQLKNSDNILPTYKSNSLNLSCIIEEEPPPSMMNTNIIQASGGDQDPNANSSFTMTSDPNLNSSTTTTVITSSESPGNFYTETTTTKVSQKRSAGSPTFSLEQVIQDHFPESSSSPSMEPAGVEPMNPMEGESSDICFHSSVEPEETETDGTGNYSIPTITFTSIPTNFPNGNENNESRGETTQRDDASSPPHASAISSKQGKSINGTKNVCLKRVSFGSSKGSMVETVIFEIPQPDEQQRSPTTPTSDVLVPGTIPENDAVESANTATGSTGGSRPPSRVRVTFFESEKPLALSSPDGDTFDLDLSNMTLQQSPVETSTPNNYSRHLSADSGWENPFRPDGDLSKEADQIVELIKGGKPINDETLRSISPSVNENETEPEMMRSTNYTNNLTASPPSPPQGKGTNGSANGTEIQRGVVVPPAQTAAVEHVTLKKKKGCCVIQ